MPYLQLQDRQFPLPAGEATIGTHEGANVRLPGSDAARAIVTVSPKGVSIRRGTDGSVVLVNGVQLGAEPSPLLHGDRVEVAGHELRVGEDQKGGSTQFVGAADVAAMVQMKAGSVPSKPTTATGGRIVSLVDGREYQVGEQGLTFGREVGHDVVIASSEISRKHASIAPGPDGYVITDHSTNGVWINGQRMGDTQVLGRGDVIKMGAEEFRFYADVLKAAAAAPLATPVAPPPHAPPPPAASAPVKVAPETAQPAPTPMPPTPGPVRTPLATLQVLNEGPLKGRLFELHSALTNIGRGEHNDICLKDESVSDSHAKLQKRGDGWWLVDQGSTNGTYIGGRRIDEQRIEGAPDLRFGGIKMAFKAAGAAAPSDGGGTRAIAAVDAGAARRAAASRTPALAKTVTPPPPEPRKKGCASVLVFFLTVAGAGAGLLVMGLFHVAGR
jgi:pSer/pThr/pTyr-binding forkhead associated (FHA) protein